MTVSPTAIEAVFDAEELLKHVRDAVPRPLCVVHVAIGETVISMTPPFLSQLLKHLSKVGGGAAE